MKTQISRSTYRPGEHYSSVRHQQGRMIVDADLNEQADIVDGRLADALAATVLSGAPARDGLAWKVENGKLKLVPGRLYVNGLAARLEGAAGQGIGLADQPDYPGAVVPSTGSYRVYADVWERSVTALEDGELMDAGLHGADTATRSRTMLQVKTRPMAPAALPATRGNALLTLTLNTSTTSGAGSDPCAATGPVNERIGNYLFRVEVHDLYRDSANKAHLVIKWSRDNGSEACHVGDEPPGFTQNVWTWEFFDAASEKQAGLHPSVQKVRRGVLVDGAYAIPAAGSPRTFVRQWDGCADINLDDATVSGRERGVALGTGPNGKASFDSSSGKALVLQLEAITLRLQVRTGSADHVFVPGDYWLASVREAERAELEQASGGVLLDQAAPAGVTHHYLELGTWNGSQFTAPDGVTDAAWKQCLRFRPLTDLQADGMSYALPATTAPADSLRDRLTGFREYAADQRITVQAALDALALKLDAGSIPYGAGSNPVASISDLMVKKTGDTMTGDLTVNAKVTVNSFRLVPRAGTPDKAILSYEAGTGLAKWLETSLTAWNLSGGNLSTDPGSVSGAITIGTPATGGAPPLCVANGRVGIGTSDPKAPLHIVANAGDTAQDFQAYGLPWLYGKHIADGATQMWGLRNVYGRLLTWDSDSFFVGLQDAGSNRKDAVIAWGDDSSDRLRFLFTAPASSASAASAPDPVEIMQVSADGALRVGGEGGATLAGSAGVGAIFGQNVVPRDARCAPATDAPFAAIQACEGALSFHTSPGELASALDVNPRVFIDAQGNVGIGTTDTGHGRLVVDGDLYLTGRLIEGGGIVALARKDIDDIHADSFGGEKKLGGTSFVLERSCEVTFHLAILTDSSTSLPVYVRLHGAALTQPLTLFDSLQVDTSGVLLQERSERLFPGFYVLEIACTSTAGSNHDIKTLSVVATQRRTAGSLATGISSPVL